MVIILLLLLPYFAVADVPAYCYEKDVAGNWIF
jgi:hypothetical protein